MDLDATVPFTDLDLEKTEAGNIQRTYSQKNVPEPNKNEQHERLPRNFQEIQIELKIQKHGSTDVLFVTLNSEV